MRRTRKRPLVVVGAPSSLGIRPYDDGGMRALDRAPAALREQGLVARLDARDAGDVTPPAYVDFERPGVRPRNEDGVAAYSRDLARAVAEASADGAFVVVLGGDCSIVLGCLLAFRQGEAASEVGLAYVDAHADFATPEESRTGSAASMCLALAVGRGATPLARLAGTAPLVRADHVALIGRRDPAPTHCKDAFRTSGILDLPDAALRSQEPAAVAAAALDRLAAAAGGFWIHVDADAFDPAEVPAVDSPTPGGPSSAQLRELVSRLAGDPRALGLELTIYDPGLDPDGGSAALLAGWLAETLGAA